MEVLTEINTLKAQINELYIRIQSNPKLSAIERFRIEEEIKTITLKINLMNLELNTLRNEKNLQALNT